MPFTPQSYEAAITALIEARIESEWIDGDSDPLTVIAWPLVEFEPPTNAAWLKVDILFGDSFARTVSGNNEGVNSNVGVIQLSVFAPKGQGAGALNTLTGKARDIFSRHTGGGLICQASGTGFQGIDGAWAYRTIRTNFQAYELVSA